jgi:nucleotide-binding universal stress UspA family protein
VEHGAASEARVGLAAGLAQRCKARLIGVAAHPSVVPAGADAGALAFSRGVYMEEEQRFRSAALAAENRFRTLAAERQVIPEWRTAWDDPGTAIVREACFADIVIVGRERYRRRSEVLLHAGRPVVMAPQGVFELSGRTVVIAWKDTREARRAVGDALPLLKAAESVHVLQVRHGGPPQDERASVNAVVCYLRWHGVCAHGETPARGERSVADEVLRYAQEHGADLIVAGAYGQSRMREMAFGGVTDMLLERSPVCCCLSH